MAADEAGTDIAIVGMAGRFPGAADVDRFWERVVAGEDCLTDVAESDLAAGKIPASLRFNPDYVRRTGKVDDVDRFDAGFFSIGPRDAAIMDPQHRLFLETAWEALESAGVVPGEFDGAIGVFAGCGMNSYLVHNLLTNPQIFETLGWFLVRHTGNDKDFLATEVSYKLDLRGPSINVQTACSTSLVAVHLAISSLLAFECDVALAGGVTIEAPHGTGYLYREGEILAKDGRCRAFDLHSSGTVLTGGVGAVALRRLDDALADGDEVLAVIKGSAVNNDGQRKAGYLAPSVDGHADVVREALSVAGIDARTIGMIEAHGTGTSIGDPIEVAALTAAFRTFTKDSQFCRLVSSKPNIGHLDTAAGVASLIKAVQALRHKTLPPLANHSAPSEMFDITRTPFVLSGEAAPWPEGPHPRRVGISSLGVGGTNAHVIIEEAPPLAVARQRSQGVPRLLVVSARSESSAQRMASVLADRLERVGVPGFDGPSLDLDAVASTLLHHRRRFDHRLAVAAVDLAGAVEALRAAAQRPTSTVTGDHRVGLLLPGGGSQYPAMGKGLMGEAVFESTVRDGIAILRELTGVDLEPALRGSDALALAADLESPTWSLPSILITEVAMARLWMSWGITPSALMGHSLGEYAAAHLAGVMSLADAIALVHKRADIMERASVGGVGMLVIPLPEDDIVPLLGDRLDLAAVNAADEVVVSGPRDAIEELAAHLSSRDVQTTLLPLTAAAHSRLLEPYLGEFEALLRSMALSAPALPVITNLTGELATAEQLTDPMHWVTHLRRPVRFADGLATFATMVDVAVDTGPGQALSSAARRAGHDQLTVIAALRHHKDSTDDVTFTYGALAKAWMAGVEPDWDIVNGERTEVVQLPTYRFDRERYWIEPGDGQRAGDDEHLVELAPIERWGWSVDWIDAPAATVAATGSFAVLCHGDRSAFGNELLASLAGRSGVSGATVLDWPTSPGSFDALDIGAADHVVVVLGGSGYDDAEDWALVALSALMRGLGERGRDVRVSVITPGALPAGGHAPEPAFALALGPTLVAGREYPEISGRIIDIDPASVTAGDVADEIMRQQPELVALRADRRLVRTTTSTNLDALDSASPDGVLRSPVLVIGGLSEIAVASLSAQAVNGRLDHIIVTSREVIDDPDSLELANLAPTDARVRRAQLLAQLRATGARVDAEQCDPSDADSVRSLFDRLASQALVPATVVYAAGTLADGLLALTTEPELTSVARAKAAGALATVDAFASHGGGDVVLFSSSSSIAVPAGQANYVGANAVLDALAGASCGSGRITTVNWSAWRERGMGATANRRNRLGIRPGRSFDHPVLTEVVDSGNGAVLYGSLDRSRWVVAEHATDDGTALLPGAGILELMAVATRHLGAPICEQIDLLTPLAVASSGVTDVRVKATAAGEDTWDLVLESAAPGSGDWELHATATARGFGRVAAPEMPDAPAIDGVSDPFGVQRTRLHLGPRWSAVVDVREAPGSHATGTLALAAAFDGEDARWFAHPALVDTAIATAVHLVGQADGELVVPMSFGAVQLGEPLLSGATVNTAMRTNDHGHDVAVADLELINPNGEMVLRLNGLVLRTVRGALSLPSIAAAHESDDREHTGGPGLLALVDRSGLDHAEGADAFRRAIATGVSHVLISKISPAQLIAEATPAKRVVAPASTVAADGPSLGADRVSRAVGDAWRSLLGVSSASPGDDFFAMGGHSLIAVRLFAKIHQEFGVRMALTTLFDAPTLGELIDVVRVEVGDEAGNDAAGNDGAASDQAASGGAHGDGDVTDETSQAATDTATRVDGSSDQSSSAKPAKPAKAGGPARRAAQCLVPVKRSGDRAPLLCVHGRGGNVLGLMDLGRAMPEHRPFYGVQAFAVTGDRMPDRTISAMAARYVDGLLESGLRLPVHIAGYSGGGLIAIEMARVLKTKGLPLGELVLFDTPHPTAQGLGKVARLRNLVQNAASHGPSSVMRWARGRKEHAATLARMESLTDDSSMADAGIVDLSDFFDLAAFRHRFEPLDIEAHLITVEEFDATAPKDNGWSETDFRRLHRHVVAGNHLDMLAGEHAKNLSRLLDEILTK